MRGSLSRLGYVGVLVGAFVLGSAFQVFGSSAPTVFHGCLGSGGTLFLVTTNGSAPTCPGASTPVSWNQAGQPGPAGGLTAIQEISSSTNFVVPAGVTHLSVEAWGGGGGG